LFSSLAFSERPFCDQTILVAGVAEMSAISSSLALALAVSSGEIDISSIFTQTSTGNYILSGNSDLSFDNTLSSAAVFVKGSLIAEQAIDIESAFTETSNGIMIGSGEATKTFTITQTSNGEFLFTEVNAGANTETYTTITPSGTENYTEITPSGSETWTEIQ